MEQEIERTIEQATERFGQLPAEYHFGDVDTCIELIWLVRSIAGEGAPREFLKRLLMGLSTNFNALKTRIQGKVGRAELRKRLQVIADGAGHIRKEMEDPAILSKLIAEERAETGSCAAHEVEARRRALEDLAHLAAAATRRVPKGKGGKRCHSDGPTAQEMCAFIVSRLWHEARGEWPGSQNPEVWDACERLWVAAGGESSPRNGETPVRWRRPLKQAKTPPAPPPLGAAVMEGADGRIAIGEVLGPQSEGSTKKA